MGTLLLALLGAHWAVSAALRSRAQTALQRRLDMNVAIGDASLRTWGAALDDVRLEGRNGGVRVSVKRVEARGSLLRFVLRGASAADRIHAQDVDVSVNLAHAGVVRSIARARKAFGASAEEKKQADAQDRSTREVSVENIALRVDDGAGALVRAAGGSVRRNALGQTVVSAREVTLGASPGDVARVSDAVIEIATEQGNRVVSRATIGSGEIVWAERGSLLDRLSQAEDLARRTGAERASRTHAQSRSSARTSWRERLAKNAEIEVHEANVRRRTGAQIHDVLRSFEGSVQRVENDLFHAQGSGMTGAGGQLRWDMRVAPEHLRAEGTIAFERLPLAFAVPFLPDLPWYEPERAVMNGSLLIRGDGPSRVYMRGSVSLENVALSSPRISPTPVRDIALRLAGEASWMPAARRLEINQAEVTSGNARAEVRGVLEWAPDHYAADLSGVLPPTDCNAAVSAIPRDLLADTGGFSWSGNMGGRLHLRVDSRKLDETRLSLDIAENCEFVSVPTVADLRRVRGSFTHSVREPDGTLFEMTTGPGTANWAPIEAISPFFLHAVLAHEDASFFAHHGFAPWAIEEALARNLAARRYVQGASTITMQLAKNLFLQREKTLARKMQEVILTWWLEHALDKRDILELYVNVIEYAPGVYGILSAAHHYFGRDPSELSPAESAFLANVLPAPKLYQGQFARGTASPSMLARMRRLLEHMTARGRIDADALAYGIAELPAFRLGADQAQAGTPRMLPKGASPLPFDLADTANDWETIESEETFEDPGM